MYFVKKGTKFIYSIAVDLPKLEHGLCYRSGMKVDQSLKEWGFLHLADLIKILNVQQVSGLVQDVT